MDTDNEAYGESRKGTPFTGVKEYIDLLSPEDRKFKPWEMTPAVLAAHIKDRNFEEAKAEELVEQGRIPEWKWHDFKRQTKAMERI